MMIHLRHHGPFLCALAAALVLSAGSASAQPAKSVALAKELTTLLDQAKLDSVAAKDPASPEHFVAALYIPGRQLLVVSANYSAPVLLDEPLGKREYREVYIELNSAGIPDSKQFFSDAGADGLRMKPNDNQPFDTFDSGKANTSFDGDWKKQKLASEDEYTKTFAGADGRYTELLTLLLNELKKKS